jgi:hypothetical protein
MQEKIEKIRWWRDCHKRALKRCAKVIRVIYRSTDTGAKALEHICGHWGAIRALDKVLKLLEEE